MIIPMPPYGMNWMMSVTPKLVIKSRIEDSTNPDFFWDVSNNTARFSDIYLAEINRMSSLAIKKEFAKNTVSGQIFNSVVVNKNATVSDFMNAISEIQKQVKIKYNQLNLN